MKKLTAVLMALILVFYLGCAAFADDAADAAPAEITQENWLVNSLTVVDWVQKDGRASLEIAPDMDEETEATITATLFWANSAFDGIEWTFYCKYDTAAHMLIASDVLRMDQQFDDDGEVSLATNAYFKESDAVFELDESGLLILITTDDEALSSIGFEPVPAVEVKVAELTEVQAALVASVQEKLMGVDYEPVGVLCEMDDMLLCVLCEATVVYPGAEPYPALMLISNGEEGPVVEIAELADSGSDG